jgi:hypothetical protein
MVLNTKACWVVVPMVLLLLRLGLMQDGLLLLTPIILHSYHHHFKNHRNQYPIARS